MANRNKIQGAGIIQRCASDFQTAMKQLSNICGDYTGGALKTLGNQQLTQKLNTISNQYVKINENLANAYKAVCALSGGLCVRLLISDNFLFKCGMVAPWLRFGYNFDISVNSEKCDSLHSGIGTIGNKLLDIHSHLSAPLHEMENLIVQDQWVSTLNTLDILFPFNGINKLAHVIKVKNIAISNLKDARKRLKLLQSYVGAAANARQNGGRTLYYTLDDIKTKLVNCEDNVKKRMYRLDIRLTSRITEDSGTSAEDLQNAVDRLNKKQQEYIYMYGQPSPELAAEIERLKKMMGYSHNGVFYTTPSQNFSDFAMYQGKGTPYCTSAALCMALAMYYERSKSDYDFTSYPYWIDGKGVNWGDYYDPDNSNPWKDMDAGTIFTRAYNELKKGKPCIFYGPNGNRISGYHAVTIVGVAANADPNNLKPEDFLVIDPADGKVKSLSEVGYTRYNARVITIKDK